MNLSQDILHAFLLLLGQSLEHGFWTLRHGTGIIPVPYGIAMARSIKELEVSGQSVLEVLRIVVGLCREHGAAVEYVVEGLQFVDAQPVVGMKVGKPHLFHKITLVQIWVVHIVFFQDVQEKVQYELGKSYIESLQLLEQFTSRCVTRLIECGIHERPLQLTHMPVVDAKGADALLDLFLALLRECIIAY